MRRLTGTAWTFVALGLLVHCAGSASEETEVAGDPTQAAAGEELAAEVEEHLGRLEKLGFAGTVVVAVEGRPLVAGGWGLADRERGIPWTPSTVSTVGSITKQFTGAAILALVEAEKLSVEQPITDFFEGVPEEKRGITVHQLLTHSSGIVDVDGIGDFDPIGREELVRRALEQELAFTPGSSYAYSNAGYSLLGAIVERLSGGSWESWVRERLLLPAGMYETGYVLAGWGEGRLAQGYRDGERWGTVVERPFAADGPWWVLRANGGIHSTAWDMLRWGRALLDGRALSEESMRSYWSPWVDEGGGDSHYGYGWVVVDVGGSRVITHDGGNGIFFAEMAIVPDAELVIVLMTNVAADFPATGRLLQGIGRRVLAGEPLPSVPDLVEVEPAELAHLAGRYTLSDGGAWSVRVGAGPTGTAELAVEAEDREAFAPLLSIREVDGERARRLEARIEEVTTSYLAGDLRPLWEAYGRPGVFEDFAPRQLERLRQLEAEHGEPRGHRILGTAFRDGRDVTLVRIDFERGTVDRAWVWDPYEEEALRGYSIRGLDPVLHLLPEAGGTFASWDARAGISRPVRFTAEADGRMRLTIGDDPAFEAVREP